MATATDVAKNVRAVALKMSFFTGFLLKRRRDPGNAGRNKLSPLPNVAKGPAVPNVPVEITRPPANRVFKEKLRPN
jgi:hypothetical protein